MELDRINQPDGCERIRELLIEEIEGEGWDFKEADQGLRLLVSQTRKRRFQHIGVIDVVSISVVSAKKYPAMLRKICERVEAQIEEESSKEEDRSALGRKVNLEC